MPFQEGHNFGKGRPKGSKNKVDGTIKQFLKDMIEGNTAKIENELNSLKGKAFLDAMFNFMEYVQPKLSRSEVELEQVETTDLSNVSQETLDKLHDELNASDSTEGTS
jgi:hypothetical protein